MLILSFQNLLCMVKESDQETTEETTQISIPRASFNRDILGVLQALCEREQMGIYAAQYECSLSDFFATWSRVARKKKLAGALMVSRQTQVDQALSDLDGTSIEFWRVTKPRKHWGPYKDKKATEKNYEDMHHKIFIFEKNAGDKPLVVTGSFNLSDTAARYHAENIVILDDPNAIGYFTDELNRLHGHASALRMPTEKSVFPLKVGHKDPRLKVALPRVVFSPEIREVVKKLIADEQEFISGAQFRFTLYDVAEAWGKAKVGGELMLDSQYAQDFVEALTHLRNHKVQLYWVTKKYFPGADKYVLVHHKFLIFRKNAGDKKLLMTGSFNMTGQASENNWENIVILDDPEVIESFEGEIEVLRKDAQLIQPKSLVYKGKAAKLSMTKKMNGL